ncbi:hypothetical protein JTL44_35120, partial [Pseudomonas aeruginosa]|nr:hypothetical protein [Pseudomonas aeruginosa]
MSSLQTTNPQQACEAILIEGKRYNIEHGILPSENAVAGPSARPWRRAEGRLRRVVREAAPAPAGTQGLPGPSAEYGGV